MNGSNTVGPSSGLITVNREQIVKEGWLQKRGEFWRSWKSRYFVLLDDGVLAGFKNKLEEFGQVEPLINFAVKDCQMMSTDRPKPFTFIIRVCHCTTVVETTFCVETEQERKDWMAAIKMVSERISDCQDVEMSHENGRTGTMEDLCQRLSLQGTAVSKSTAKQKVTLESFKFIKLLGTGSFGKVILCRETATDQIFAIKIVKKELIIRKREVAHIQTENRVLRSTNHPFLTSLRYSFQTSDKLCFVMEYVNGGEIFFHLSTEGFFSEERTKFYVAEIILALAYLHSKAIIYRDLKPENLLLDKDGHVKIADFGLCKEDITYEKTTRTFCGTPEYLAPEVLENNDYGRAVDWWGIGVVMYEMLTGSLPFYNTDRDALFTLIMMGEVKYPKTMSKEAKGLLKGLLVKDPARRLGGGPEDAKEIMAHTFFSCIDWNDLEQKKIPTPFKPQLTSDTDTRYFDTEFTEGSTRLTTPDSSRPVGSMEGEHYFPQFSFRMSATHDSSASTSGSINGATS